jgi:hypothetical protein
MLTHSWLLKQAQYSTTYTLAHCPFLSLLQLARSIPLSNPAKAFLSILDIDGFHPLSTRSQSPPNNDVNKIVWILSVPHLATTKERWVQLCAGNSSLMDPSVKHYYKDSEGITFDDVNAHDVVNDSDEIRVILFLDIARNMSGS